MNKTIHNGQTQPTNTKYENYVRMQQTQCRNNTHNMLTQNTQNKTMFIRDTIFHTTLEKLLDV